ncbi:hypothetical protein JCM11491_001047 [Sporobolomyces phaffii]
MLYVGSAQPSTAQLGALRCDFYDKDAAVLVINKFTRLELYTVQSDGSLELAEEIPVWSGISAIASVKLPGEERSSIVVLTTCLRLFLVSYQPHSIPKIHTVSSISIVEPFGRLSEYQTIQVDPHGRCLVIHAYDGLVRVVSLLANSSTKPVRRGSTTFKRPNEPTTSPFDLGESFNVRISNLNVTSLALLTTDPDSAPAFSVVNTDHTGAKLLTTYNIVLEEKDIEEGPVQTETLQDPGSELCLGLADAQGVLVVGEESVTFFDVERPMQDSKGKRKATSGKKEVKCRLPLARITSYAFVSRDYLLLGDIFGKLFLVFLSFGATTVESLTATDLGDTTSPTAIVPLGSSLIYLASRFGDAQLVKVPARLTASVSGLSRMVEAGAGDDDDDEDLQLVASYPNLAPIVDSCIVGGERGSAGYVVSCSGAYKSGSLRVVRRGVGFTELATVDLEGVQRMWSLSSDQGSQYLVLAFFDETRIVRITQTGEGGDLDFEVEETELAPFKRDAVALFAGRLGEVYVQVTKDAVEYASVHGDSAPGRWVAEGGEQMTTAAAADGNLLVALQGGGVVLLALENGDLIQQSTCSFDAEIASIGLHATSHGSFAVVGIWTSPKVHLLSLPDLAIFATQTLPTAFPIRSVLLTTFNDGATVLFVGLGDGSLVTIEVDVGARQVDSTSLKTVVLGDRPFLLSNLDQDGKDSSVFACSDRPTVISRSKERLVYSSVNVADVAAVAALGGSDEALLAVASPHGLRLGQMNALQQIDVRTIPLDEDEPRRVAHDPKQRTFGVLCSRRDVDRVSGSRSVHASVRFLTEETFANRTVISFGPGEEGQAITAFASTDSTFFAVGTAILQGDATEPEKGRLVVFRQVDSKEYVQAAEIEVNGCPYAITELGNGCLALAVNSQVLVFTFDEAQSSLSLSASWSGAFIALALARGPGTTLVVGDALRSITLLEYTHSPRPNLKEVARDYRSRYMVGVESILPPSANIDGSARELIGAETDLNLFTVQYDPSSAAGRLEDAGSLVPRGIYHLGEMVSRFRHGTFGQQFGDSSGVAQATLVFTTSAGSIGVITKLDPVTSTLLSSLERNMRSFLKGVGGLSQEAFRSFKAENRTVPSKGFIDGSFVQQFLELSAGEQDKIMGGRTEFERLSASKGELVRVLEEVGRLH